MICGAGKITKIAMVLTLLFVSGTCFAGVSSDDLAFDGSTVLVEVCYLKELDDAGTPKFLRFDKASFDTLGALRTVNIESVNWTYKLNNPNQIKKSGKKKFIQKLKNVFLSTPCDIVVNSAADENQWTAYSFNKSSEKVRSLFKAARPKSIESSGLHRWMLKWLGFQGVVVGTRGGKVVVFAEKRQLKRGSQAIVIGGSKNRFKFRRKTKKSAEALLQFSEMAGDYALFDVLLKADEANVIKPGMKIFFGEN